MAKKLSVQIALEGGAEIERQLADIGDAGRKAFTEIAKASEEIGGFRNMSPEGVTEALKQMGVTGVNEINKIQAAVKRAGRLEGLVQGIAATENAVTKLTNAWKIFTRVLGPLSVIGTAVTALGQLATAAENTIVTLGNLATRGGISIAEIARMRQAFMAAGGSAEEFAKIVEKFAGSLDKLKTDRIAALTAETEKLKAAGWGDEAVQRWLEDQVAALDRMAPAGKNAADKMAEFARHLVRLETNAQRFAAVQRELGSATQQQVDALVQYGLTIDQTQGKLGGFTQAQLDQALANQRAVTELSNAWLRLKEIVGTLGMGQTFTNMMTGLVQAFTNGLVIIDAGFKRIPAAASAAWNAILSVAMPVVTTISQAWQGFVMAFNNGLAILKSAWDGFIGAIMSVPGMIGSAFESIMGVINAVTAAINAAWEALKRLLGLGEQVGGAGGNPVTGGQGFAGGGRVGGRGTGTSDSNLAWVSRGEHIMPARAVRQPGVLAFLEALRRSGGNLSRVLDGMGRFALGGMVPRSVPAFAAGGVVGGMSNVTIQFPGLPEIGGLRASSVVVAELRKAAAMAQVRAGGRKPSRYR